MRPPKDMRGQPAGNMIQSLFKHIGNSAKKKGENSGVFLNPEFNGISMSEQ